MGRILHPSSYTFHHSTHTPLGSRDLSPLAYFSDTRLDDSVTPPHCRSPLLCIGLQVSKSEQGLVERIKGEIERRKRVFFRSAFDDNDVPIDDPHLDTPLRVAGFVPLRVFAVPCETATWGSNAWCSNGILLGVVKSTGLVSLLPYSTVLKRLPHLLSIPSLTVYCLAILHYTRLTRKSIRCRDCKSSPIVHLDIFVLLINHQHLVTPYNTLLNIVLRLVGDDTLDSILSTVTCVCIKPSSRVVFAPPFSSSLDFSKSILGA